VGIIYLDVERRLWEIGLTMNALKRIIVHLFFRDKFRGQLVSIIAGALASLLIAYLPNVPGFVVTVLGLIMQLPEGAVIDKPAVIVFLTPVVAAILNSIAQEIVARDANKALTTLKGEGVYPLGLDNWVGPIANAGLQRLADDARNHRVSE
jgi:hypothetical protein